MVYDLQHMMNNLNQRSQLYAEVDKRQHYWPKNTYKRKRGYNYKDCFSDSYFINTTAEESASIAPYCFKMYTSMWV